MSKCKIIVLIILTNLSINLFSLGKDILTDSMWSISNSSGVKENIKVKSVLNYLTESKDKITLETQFSVTPTESGNLGIILYKNNMAFDVYINNIYIDSIGKMPDNFFLEPYITRGIQINESIIKSNNTLRIVAWNDSGIYKLRKIEVMDLEIYKKKMSFFNFLDIQLPRFASVLLFFVALYSVFLFITYPERRLSLYLGISSFLFGLHLLHVTIAGSPLPYIVIKGLLFSCFPLSMMFLFYYFNSFFKINAKKITLNIISVIGIALSLGYFLQGNSSKLDSWHTLILIYPVSAIAFGAYGAIKNLKKKEKGSIPILLGLFIAIAFSAYDIYYFVGVITQTIILQGFGFMAIIFGSFYSFSVEIADTNKQCSLLATNLQKNNNQRNELFRNIQENTVKSEDSGNILNQSLDRVGALVSQYFVSVENIYKNLVNQNEHVIKNRENVAHIFHAVKDTSKMVNQHGELVNNTVQDIKTLSKEILQVDNLVKKSGNTIEKLTNVCLSAEKDVATSITYINDLVEYSKKINDIVNSISDLSEQTNILSINAAIEAARSGHVGKGFAVVAGEIRSLASKSGSSAEKINEIMTTMISKIVNIQNQETKVSRGLKEIILENTEIARDISNIFKGLQAQIDCNTRIERTIKDLISTVEKISTHSVMQENSSMELKNSLDLLSEITQTILTASEEQKSCNNELKLNLNQLQKVSENNLGVITNLKALTS
jgi:methyl-accepting chemotaxis protein